MLKAKEESIYELLMVCIILFLIEFKKKIISGYILVGETLLIKNSSGDHKKKKKRLEPPKMFYL